MTQQLSRRNAAVASRFADRTNHLVQLDISKPSQGA